MPPYLLRLAYVCQFLLALIAVWTVWSQVGGQTHLDLMPWYAKLTLSMSLSWVVVMGTMSAVADASAWNRRVIFYLVVGFAIASGMAMSAPIAPSKLANTITEAKATAG